MQRLLSALVAIMSFASVLCGINVTPVTAQDRPSPSNAHDGVAPTASTPSEDRGAMVLQGITRENVEVKDRSLIIEGDVKGSVHAINSKVTMMPGAIVEGTFTVEGGTLLAAPGHPVFTNRPVMSRAPLGRQKKGDWFGGQFCLWLLGLGGGLIVLLAAPNATTRVSETVSLQPGRSLVAGLVTAAIMLAALAVSGMIMSTKSFLSLLWMPVMIVIVLASLFLLVFGWLAGMRRMGDLLASRYGQIGSGTFYGRMALGLSAFFLANSLLGAINPALGAAGLLVEFAVALMGIGAIVRTGFGRDDQWLGRQFGRQS